MGIRNVGLALMAFALLISGCAWGQSAEDGSGTTLKIKNGRPVVTTPEKTFTSMYSETFPHELHKRNVQMAEAGVEVFFLIVRGGYKDDFGTNYFWRGPGEFGTEKDREDNLTLQEQAERILEVAPDARFMVRWGSSVPVEWGKEYPGDMQATDNKRLEGATFAAENAVPGRTELARRIVDYCESQEWGDRVIGYFPFGPNEGQMKLSISETLFDQSAATLKSYVDFLKTKYETNKQLQKAWNDDSVTFSNVVLPDEEEWKAERENWMHWPDPKKTQRYRDYFLAMRQWLAKQTKAEVKAVREASDKPALVGVDAFKQPMMGWLILDAFSAAGHGMDWRNFMLGSGSVDVGPMLDTPELDALITPADYTARSCGFGWGPEGIGDSMVLRGKTIFVEDDARSFAMGENTQGAWRNPQEARAGLMRNLAIGASRGFIPYWMNVMGDWQEGGGFFDDPTMLEIVEEQLPVREKLLTRPFERTEHAVALIIDDTSPLYEDFTAGFQNLAVLRQRVDELANTGLPWRIFLLSDLKRDNFPTYRTYILPNLFHITEEKEKLIRDKLFRDGSVVIFGPGTGIVGEEKRTAEPASNLLGFPLDLVKKPSARRVLVYGGDHPAVEDIRGPFTYGDSYTYGPVLQPADELAEHDAVELGKVTAWWGCNRAGLALKEFGKGALGNEQGGEYGDGDYAVAFSMAVPLPSKLVRSLALYGGCTPWSNMGDVVAANGNMVSVHSVRGGEHTVRLPYEATLKDAVSGDVVAEETQEHTFDMEAPGTRVFLMDKPSE